MGRTSVKTQRRTGLTKELRSIIKRDRCVCERTLDNHSREAIEKLISRQEERTGDGINDFRQDQLRREREHLATPKVPDLDVLIADQMRLADELEETKQAIDRLEEETGELANGAGRDIWGQVVDIKADLKSREQSLMSQKEIKDELGKRLDSLRRER